MSVTASARGPQFRLPNYDAKSAANTIAPVDELFTDDKACPKDHTASRHSSTHSSEMEAVPEEGSDAASEDTPALGAVGTAPQVKRWWRTSNPDVPGSSPPRKFSLGGRFSVSSRRQSNVSAVSAPDSSSSAGSRRTSEAVRRPSYVPRSAASGYLNTTTARRTSTTPQPQS